jgi:transcriptional regulator with XRE-family HTH domain
LCDAKYFSRPCAYAVKFPGAPFLLALALGTGSHISPDALYYVHTTGGAYLDLDQRLSQAEQQASIISAKDQVSALKMWLGLSISDLANVLHVQRPTIYQWLSGTEPRRNNLQRLSRLYGVAIQWRDLSNEPPGSYLRAPILDGRSLVDLMCEKEINLGQISSLLRRIHERLVSDLTAKSQRSISARLAHKGYQQPTKEEQLDSIRGVGTLVSGGDE